jgi:arylformamidase
MRRIDLSMTIKDHWRWKIDHTLRHDFERGDDFRSSILNIGAHAFTHVDTPLHCKPGSYTLEGMDVFAYSGIASIIDLSFIRPNEEITLNHVLQDSSHVVPGEIILLKTCWDLQRDPNSKEYWTQAPYVSDEAALWLKEMNPKAVGFDFPQDYPLRFIDRGGNFTLEESTTHKYLLLNGILHIEYLCNMAKIKKNRVELICLPLKLEGFEGAPARAVALEEE